MTMLLPLFIMELTDPNDREAMSRIYEDYCRYMYTTAYHILRNRNDAEDALHDCWMSWCNPNDIKKIRKLYQAPECGLRQFVATCIRNKCFNMLRSKKVRIQSIYENEDKLISKGTVKIVATLEETVELRQEVLEAFESIHSLPPYQRRVMKMRYIEEHAPIEIAGIMGTTINVVNAALSKAKKRLRLDIQPEGDMHGKAI